MRNRSLRLLFLICVMLLSTSLIHLTAQENTQEAESEETEAPEASPIPATPVPTPDPSSPASITEGERAQVALYFRSLPQGRAGLIAISGTSEAPRLSFLDKRIDTFQVPNDPSYYALLTAPLDQAQRTYELEVIVLENSSETERILVPVSISSGGFIRQDVILTPDQLDLLDEELEQAELNQIFQMSSHRTPQRLWDERRFRPPVAAALTSPFGAVRVFNGVFNTIHTGWDYQATTGQPMLASGTGRVAFAGPMNIRGNYVLIDHGYGLYSGYAHLSVTHVTQGQVVKAGQIIGQVGSTGRSSSSHAHLEFIANDQWIDPADFIAMYIP